VCKKSHQHTCPTCTPRGKNKTKWSKAEIIFMKNRSVSFLACRKILNWFHYNVNFIHAPICTFLISIYICSCCGIGHTTRGDGKWARISHKLFGVPTNPNKLDGVMCWVKPWMGLLCDFGTTLDSPLVPNLHSQNGPIHSPYILTLHLTRSGKKKFFGRRRLSIS
jgi:hypothetical protein